MGKTRSKKIVLMIDNMDTSPTKIYFCEFCISTKITQNLSTKPILKITTKLGRIHVDF